MPTRTVYGTQDLLGVYRDLDSVPDFWLQFFASQYNSDKEEIEWSKISNYRHLAPLVLPTAQGRPTYKAAERLVAVRPGYLKPKDPVTGSGMLVRKAGLGELGQLTPLTPEQRYQATVVAILQKHRTDIERRWEWMASEAIQHGKITLEDDGYPSVDVDFERDGNLTVTLTGSATWDTAGADIIKNVDTWVNRMTRAKFGGSPNVMIVGPDAWEAMADNDGVKALLDRDIRNTSGTQFDLGVGNGERVQFKGNLSRNLPVWVYAEQYDVPTTAGTDTATDFMNSSDVVMVGPGVSGVRAFGAIQDIAANLQSVPVFPKMWEENDPSATIIMTQSAPLMVPVNPNATFRARVL